MTSIMAIRIDHRSNKAPDVQTVLTRHGCIIRMRVGCHETSPDFCAEDGIILLHLCPRDQQEVIALEKDLAALGGVSVNHMEV